MATSASSFWRQSSIYGVGVVLGKLASFLMLPVYTRFLTPADYGTLELLSMTIDVIGMIAGIGVGSAVFRFYSDASDEVARGEVVSTAAIGVSVLAGLTTLVGVVAATPLTRLVLGPDGNPFFLRLFFLTYLFQTCEHVPMLLLRARQQAGRVVMLNVSRLVLNLALNILLVVHFRMGVLGVLLSGAVTGGVMAVGLTAYLLGQVRLRFVAERFRAMVRFGSPMVLWTLGSFVLVFSDRFFLNHYVGTAQVGIYGLAYKFAFLLSALAFNPFDMVWDPHRYEVAKRPDAKDVYARVFLYLNVVVGLAGAAISLYVRDVLSLMSDPAFVPAYRYVPLLLLAQNVSHAVSYCTLGLFVTDRTRALGRIAFLSALAALALNVALISRFGIAGACAATLGSYALRFVWTYGAAQRHYPVPYAWGAIARLYGILAAAVALRHLVEPRAIPVSIAWSTALLVGAVVLVYSSILGPAEREYVRSVFARSRSGLLLRATRA